MMSTNLVQIGKEDALDKGQTTVLIADVSFLYCKTGILVISKVNCYSNASIADLNRSKTKKKHSVIFMLQVELRCLL